MSRWMCPKCEREFDRARQAHTCAPAQTVEITFRRHPTQRPIYARIAAAVAALGEFHEDAVDVGVFLKAQSKFAELRPKAKWLSLELVLPREVKHPRIQRSLRIGPTRIVHIIRLAAVEDVDAWVRALLTEGYLHAGG